jgi:hypothetical protein
VFDDEQQAFLAEVLASCTSRRRKIKAGMHFFRAQLGNAWRAQEEGGEPFIPEAHAPDRMIPFRDCAFEGRANPKGIPCLYMGTDTNTAMSEVRPWMNSYISLSEFRMTRDSSVINCSLDNPVPLIDDDDDPGKFDGAVWGDIASAFSRPSARDDTTADYAPTQILAELFKSDGLDGVVYKSMLGKGRNIALFDLNAAELANGTLYETKSVVYDFGQANNTYYLPKFYPAMAASIGLDVDSPKAALPHYVKLTFLPNTAEMPADGGGGVRVQARLDYIAREMEGQRESGPPLSGDDEDPPSTAGKP